LKTEDKKRPKLIKDNSSGVHSINAKASAKRIRHHHQAQEVVALHSEATLKEIRDNDHDIDRAIRDNVEKMLNQKVEDRLDIITENIIKDRQSSNV
jgi:Ni,Fe-hydrogenase maturation factor